MAEINTEQPDRTTLAYFYGEVVKFHELIGMKSFWSDGKEIQRDQVVRRFETIYRNLVLCGEEKKCAATILQLALTEFSRRDAMMALLPSRQAAIGWHFNV